MKGRSRGVSGEEGWRVGAEGSVGFFCFELWEILCIPAGAWSIYLVKTTL